MLSDKLVHALFSDGTKSLFQSRDSTLEIKETSQLGVLMCCTQLKVKYQPLSLELCIFYFYHLPPFFCLAKHQVECCQKKDNHLPPLFHLSPSPAPEIRQRVTSSVQLAEFSR